MSEFTFDVNVAESVLDVAIVGSGFAGIGMAIRLTQSGIENFRILEQSADIGGTWRDNTYPGAACDVPSHLYSFSFAPNPRWSRMFAEQKEIHGYLKDCVDRFNLREKTSFNTTIVSAKFDAGTNLWTLTTYAGRTLKARLVVMATGALNRPAYPDIPGMEDFRGRVFHTAEWDHSYALEGKKVAVIGTGASAIQVVPAIAPKVKSLTLYQRTPAWVFPKFDRPIKSLEQRLYRLLPVTQKLFRGAIYAAGEAATPLFLKPSALSKMAESIGRRHLSRYVQDPELREKLTPTYALGCKRILLSNDYYPALARENVSVVSCGVDKIEGRTIYASDGSKQVVDAIVLATGFKVPVASAPFDIIGLNGKVLQDDWKEGAEAYKGMTVTGYPNMLFTMGPNTGPGNTSVIFYIESQLRYLLNYVKEVLAFDDASLELKQEKQTSFNEMIQTRMQNTAWTSGCHSWYLTPSGKNTTLWPGFSMEYRLITRQFDRESYVMHLATSGTVAESDQSLNRLFEPALA
ncbi:MAG: NAD(P)/FAD-dependent oxidoreductase [Hahellaceae bacterium]|nr:NAD(P)/FAD-dependent oxidoreductase [Hahellaceae bacterium]MCP5169203.1 NAD(P)/FAD-dependent oxidoreductase [Hahellaceae bacterium]